MEKVCPKCGNEMKGDAKFCSKCGEKYEESEQNNQQLSFCPNCGKQVKINARFCPACGKNLLMNQTEQHENTVQRLNSGLGKFMNTINDMTGENGNVDIHLKELVSQVFKKHSIEEREELFTCGTKKTTPAVSEMITDWPKPWLFSKIFILFGATFVGLLFMILGFENPNAVPGAMFIGALIVPFSLVIFFWETNIPRNISIFDVVSIFFIGGVLSLISTLVLYDFVYIEEINYMGAILVGIVEEIGKIIVVGHYIKKSNTKYILNGLLLGACVGAGFAVFETAGYAFSSLLSAMDISSMIHTLVLRAALAIGGHTLWTAIAAVGLVVAKGENRFENKYYFSPKFLRFLVLVIVLHAIWDMPISLGSSIALVQWLLCAIAVIIVLVLLSSGLRQVSKIVLESQNE